MKQKRISMLLALVLLLGCLSGCSGSKAAFTVAVGRSVKAYSELWRTLSAELPAIGEEGYRQTMTLSPAESGSGADALQLQLTTAASGQDGAGEMNLQVNIGELTFLSLDVRSEGTLRYVSCPLLLGETCLGLDSTTLSQDLERLGLGELLDELPDGAALSLAAAAPKKASGMTEAECAALLEAGKAAVDHLQVKRGKKSEESINGSTVSCRLYTITLPASDVLCCFEALRQPLQRMLEAGTVSLLGAGEGLTPQELVDTLGEAVSSLGDVTFTAGVADQYIVLLEGSLHGRARDKEFTLEPQLQLGGGARYVDDASLCLTLTPGEDGESRSLLWRSHGDHSAASGSYTDESELIFNGDENGKITLRSSYAPQDSEQNLTFTLLDGQGNAFACGGTYHGGEGAAALEDGLLRVTYGDTSFALKVDYHLAEYEELVPAPQSPLLLSTLSQADAEQLLDEILGRLQLYAAIFSGV